MQTPGLTTDDQLLLGRCLRAAAEGPYFPDWEFHTLFGLTRAEVATVAKEWPGVTDEATTHLAINNALNNLLGYPHGMQDRLEADLGVDVTTPLCQGSCRL